MFEWPMKPAVSIEDMIRKNMLTVGIDFYFGDEDWMPHDGAERIIKENFKNIYMTTIPKAGHQIVFDNSKYLCDCIIERTKQINKE